MSVLALLGAAIASALALQSGHLAWKLAVPAGGIVALLASSFRVPAAVRAVAPVVIAFGFAALGDALLSLRAGRASWFVAGIAAYFVSHLGYLAYALPRGRLQRLTLTLTLAAFLTYAALALAHRVRDPWLLGAVVVYGFISCVSLAAAVGLRQPPMSRALFLGGIGLLFLSDTLISFNEFLDYPAWNFWILPTYYLALLAVAGSVLTRRSTDDPRLAGRQGVPEGA